MSEELTDSQLEAVKCLPGTSADVADELGISVDAAGKRLKRVQEKGLAHRDEDGLWSWDGEKDLHRMKTHHTGTITRELNNVLTDDEAGIKALLNDTEPATAIQNPDPENEDLCIVLSDLHFGDKVTDDRDRETYNTEIGEKRTREIIKQAVQESRQVPTEFDTCHLLLNGDIVTGEAVYDSQWENLDHGVAATIKDQINTAAEVLMSAVKTLAEEFETVQVVCQPGNHGENRASGVSKQANADIHVYSRLDFGVRHAGYDNIHFVFHDSTKYTNFKLRGGEVRGHIRHGEGCQEHAGATSASKRDWRGWLNMHDFDFAVRGHYHTAKVERVMGVPVIMNGSPKPPSDFEESISTWGGPGSVIFGVSDSQVPTWVRFIEF